VQPARTNTQPGAAEPEIEADAWKDRDGAAETQAHDGSLLGLDEDQMVAIPIAVNITDRHRRASAASSSSALFVSIPCYLFSQRIVGVLAFVGYNCL